MGKLDLGIKLFQKLGLFTKNTSWLTKSVPSFSKNSVWAYGPNYDKAVNYMEKYLLQEGVKKQFVPNVSKTCIKENMLNWGNLEFFEDLKRRYGDSKLLKLTNQVYGSDASASVMDITRKARLKKLAGDNPAVAERLKARPELITLSDEEKFCKKIMDKAFDTVPPNPVSSVEYRGAVLGKDSPEYKKLQKLKRGDIHSEAGYIWTTPDQNYAFGRYAANSSCAYKPMASIKYHISLPKGSKMLCVDRANPETLLKYNSQFKVHNVKKYDNGDMEVFLKYI